MTSRSKSALSQKFVIAKIAFAPSNAVIREASSSKSTATTSAPRSESAFADALVVSLVRARTR